MVFFDVSSNAVEIEPFFEERQCYFADWADPGMLFARECVAGCHWGSAVPEIRVWEIRVGLLHVVPAFT